MASKTPVSWPYHGPFNQPHIEIRIKTLNDKIYPTLEDDPFPVLVDTGYTGELLIPKPIFKLLELDKADSPQSDNLTVADGGSQEAVVVYGFMMIPKLSNEFEIKIHCFINSESNDIIIGHGFIQRFKLLLNGPQKELSIIS